MSHCTSLAARRSPSRDRALNILHKGLWKLRTEGKFMRGLVEDQHVYTANGLTLVSSSAKGNVPQSPTATAIKWRNCAKPLLYRLRIYSRGRQTFFVSWDNNGRAALQTFDPGPWMDKFRHI